MKIRPRHHRPTGQDRISIGLSPREACALAERLRDSMIARPEPGGPDLFAHDVLHELETALGGIEPRTPQGS